MTNSSVRYYAGVGYSQAGSKAVTVAGTFVASQSSAVMIIQMQGAAYDESNTENYGDSQKHGSGFLSSKATSQAVGLFEFNFVEQPISISNGVNAFSTLFLAMALNHNYSSYPGAERFQVISFPFCTNLEVESVPAVPWDGEKGGVLPIVSGNIAGNSKPSVWMDLAFVVELKIQRMIWIWIHKTRTTTHLVAQNIMGGKGRESVDLPRFQE